MITAYSMFAKQRQAVDADQPDPGPLGRHDLQARRTHLREMVTLRRGTISPNQADRQTQASDRSDHCVSNRLHLAGRHRARHRHQRSASLGELSRARPAPTMRRDLWLVGFTKPGIRVFMVTTSGPGSGQAQAALVLLRYSRLYEDGFEDAPQHASALGDHAHFNKSSFWMRATGAWHDKSAWEKLTQHLQRQLGKSACNLGAVHSGGGRWWATGGLY